MSEPDNFLARWSRRKQEAAAEKDKKTAEPTAPPRPTEIVKVGLPQEPQEQAFDISKLPPLESIGAGTDIRPFLAKGVPSELSRAALRRAWTADPAIRDFVGLAENAWDFTKPETIPGFGSLELSDEARRAMVDQFLGTHSAEKSPAAAGVEGSSRDEMTSVNPVPATGIAGGLRHAGDESARITEEYKCAQPSQPSEVKQLPAPPFDNVVTEGRKSSDQYAARTIRRRHGGALPS